MGITSLIAKLLGPPQEVGICTPFPVRLRRWMIFGNQRFKVYLHHSSHADLTVVDLLLLYPQRFFSFGIATLDANNSGEVLDACEDQGAWMILIANS